MRFSPSSLLSSPKASRTSRQFAALIGSVVNATISQAPIAFVEIEGAEFEGYIAHAPDRVPAPLPLEDGSCLFLFQRLTLAREQRYLTTAEYRYVFQASDQDESQILRFEYEREPEDENYPYPLAHLHVNASPEPYEGEKDFSELHIPTGRVTVEQLARHLVVEHGIGPISEHWETTLEEAEDSFREIQRKRMLD